jgi:hypothetical protein
MDTSARELAGIMTKSGDPADRGRAEELQNSQNYFMSSTLWSLGGSTSRPCNGSFNTVVPVPMTGGTPQDWVSVEQSCRVG